ncbi:decapping and exoribonuclease protein [Diachasma alloeum]|uniref:decapping and exoribonuclease protein n=1 Tax=Diachasma alloeum TaxID=454923 RepID=UPI0007381DF1|nr:decapping and exoribonuclease protein [Diachasma alloeum]
MSGTDTGIIFSIERKSPNTLFNFKVAKIVGYWSLDGSRNFHHNSSQLRYWIPFNEEIVKFDLNDGFALMQRRPDSLDDEKLENILRWIEGNHQKILADQRNPRWLRPHFICYRGPLAKILKSPYQDRYGWMICAMKFKGTIYICPFDTEEEKRQKTKETERDKRMTFWGKRFEHYMLSDTPYHRGDSSPVNESTEFCCVFESRLNDHRLLYAAEVDGLCSDEKFEDPLPLDRLKFMELKTDKLNATPGQEIMRKKVKSLNWWAQSYLVGVEDIVCGYRDDRNGVVRRLENKSVSGLERDSRKFWNPSVCMNFYDDFLTFMKRTVKKNYDQAVYKFERLPNSNKIIVETLPATSDYAFLPEWYISFAKK